MCLGLFDIENSVMFTSTFCVKFSFVNISDNFSSCLLVYRYFCMTAAAASQNNISLSRMFRLINFSLWYL